MGRSASGSPYSAPKAPNAPQGTNDYSYLSGIYGASYGRKKAAADFTRPTLLARPESPVENAGRNPRSVVVAGDDYKPLEERAKFLSKQQGDVTPLKSGEEFDAKNYKLYEVGTANVGQQKRVAKSIEKYKEYLQGYIDKTTKQLEKEYTTTQLRNLGIR